MIDTPTTRRGFLLSVGTAGAAMPLAWPALVRARSPNDRLNLAFIGVGDRGRWNLAIFHELGETIRCAADVDRRVRDRIAADHPHCAVYEDYRAMLDAMSPHIDAVVIATPDHHHLHPAMAAMALGKHVYLEKPLAHTVTESRRLAEASTAVGLVTQMGNQHYGRGDGHDMLKRMLAYDMIGDVHRIDCWTDRPHWPTGRDDLSKKRTGLPPYLTRSGWDLWIGPAPYRDYYDRAYHPMLWRGFWDFGSGALGDMGAHLLGFVESCFDTGPAERIEVVDVGGMTDDQYPSSCVIQFRFTSRSMGGAMDVYWHDGGRTPAGLSERLDGRKPPPNGCVIHGQHMRLMAGGFAGTSLTPLPYRTKVYLGPPPPLLPMTSPARRHAHHREWTDAIKGGGRTSCDFAKSAELIEPLLLGNAMLHAVQDGAIDVAQGVDFDHRTRRPADAALERYLDKPYRSGWEIA